MSRARLRIRRLRWQRAWRKPIARNFKAHGASLGLTPRPPDEHYPGEMVPDFTRRIAALHATYADQTDAMVVNIFGAFARAYGFGLSDSPDPLATLATQLDRLK